MMKSFLIIATLAASGALVSRADLAINTPIAVTQCDNITLSWSGGTVSVEYANGTVDSKVSAGTAKSLEIQIRAAPGTGFKFTVEDFTGITATTAVVTVGTGSDSCLPGGGTATGSSDIAELAVICTDINYGGNCIEFVSPPFDSAHPLGCAPLQAPYAGNISSAHGVTDGYTCFLYPQLGCLGTRLVISGQIPDFRAASVNFNDKALSWSCGSALTSV